MIRKFALLGLLAACTPEGPLTTAVDPAATRYLCADGTKLAAVYGTDGNLKLTVKGETVTLLAEEAASGARYGWPSDGSSYVWWTKGPEATLYWKNGETGEETPVLTTCKQAE